MSSQEHRHIPVRPMTPSGAWHAPISKELELTDGEPAPLKIVITPPPSPGPQSGWGEDDDFTDEEAYIKMLEAYGWA